jgi:hypothetical protein
MTLADIIYSLWSTSEWADLIVVAGRKEFRVHRNMYVTASSSLCGVIANVLDRVCSRSKYLAAACGGGFLVSEIARSGTYQHTDDVKEATTGRISFQEKPAVVETILAHLYEVSTAPFTSMFTDFIGKSEADRNTLLDTLLQVSVAADKVTVHTWLRIFQD